MKSIEKRKLRSDQGNPLIPLLLGIQVALDVVADQFAEQDGKEPLPIDDDAVLIALGLLRVQHTLQRWLPDHRKGASTAELDPEVKIALSSLKR